jgi:hypothetical protein
MAFYTKCGGEMGESDVVCPKCGYHFHKQTEIYVERKGWEFSEGANFFLIIAAAVMLFSCMGSLFFTIAMLVKCAWWHALLSGPASFFVSLAMMIVFLRVGKIKQF